jgi:hypothetical protein
MKHFALASFWRRYRELSPEVQALADRCFALLEADSFHPSLHFKRVGRYWSARVGLHHRALGLDKPEGAVWFWIGPHDEYDQILARR